MKKILLLLMVAIIAVAMPACNSSTTAENKNSELFSGWSESDFKKQVVYDKNGVKITATEINYSETSGPSVTFSAVGSTDKKLFLSIDNVSVNGIGLTTQTQIYEVFPNEEQDTVFKLDIFSDAKELSEHINQIGAIEFNVCVSDEAGKTVDVSERIILTVDKSVVSNIDKSGNVIFSKDGITVYKQNTTSNQSDYFAKLLVTNETNNNLTVGFEGVTLNGDVVIDSWSNKYLPANQMSYICLYNDEELLKNNKIDKVEKAVFSVRVFNNDSQEEMLISDSIELDIN